MLLKKEHKTVPSAGTQFNPINKIKFKFDKDILNMFIGYLFSGKPSISKMNISNLYKLLDMTDERSFEIDPDLYTRFLIARDAADGILNHGIENRKLLKAHCHRADNSRCDDILNSIDEFTKIKANEIKFINNAVVDRLDYAFLVAYKDIILNEFLRLDTGKYDSYKEIVTSLKEKMGLLINEIRKTEIVTTNQTFTLKEEVFDDMVKDIVRTVLDPSNALVTGVEMLNRVLSPGYMNGRLYLWLGVTGGWKSNMLLSTCYWIKKYNRINPSVEGKLPTVLYITTENGIGESVIRLFNMSTSSNDITNFTPEEVVKLMKERGGLNLKDRDTDIMMKYYGNFEISTADLYSIIEDIEDDNREVVCLVVDYIKRIRPTNRAMDERTQLANASNELKDLAVKLNIPVITAQQINRSGNMTIDAAMESGKEDLARFLGRGNIAQCWDMLENCDWAAIMNIEVERQTNKRYLTIKEIKKRYKSMTPVEYFNQPFIDGSTIQLIEDVGSEIPVAKISLATDLLGVHVNAAPRGPMSAKPRKDIAKLPGYQEQFEMLQN